MVINYDASYFFDNNKGILTSVYTDPNNYIKITNRKGEVKLYYPKGNKVSLLQNTVFSSENEVLYYFVNNQMQDLGLQKEGFQVIDSRTEDNLLVFTWGAPPHLRHIKKVEVVFDGETPIFAAYYNPEDKVFKKIYYYQYMQTAYFQIPQKITAITYTKQRDSIIQRMTFSDINIKSTPDSPYFNFKIPKDAKVETVAY